MGTGSAQLGRRSGLEFACISIVGGLEPRGFSSTDIGSTSPKASQGFPVQEARVLITLVLVLEPQGEEGLALPKLSKLCQKVHKSPLNPKDPNRLP